MLALNKLAVTASVPCFGANRYVRRAVESLLVQTHREITVVVVNDGDSNPPWAEIAHIKDPRLVRFSLERNHGPYFVHQVVLGASVTPYFLIQDADDWSAPNRVSVLLSRLLQDRSDLAFSAWQQYQQGEDGSFLAHSIRWRRREPRAATNPGGTTHLKRPHEPFLFDPRLTGDFINRASHHGLFSRIALERIGGYYGGFRINHDTLLTNLLLMTGKLSFVEMPLYNYVIRRDSLSHSKSTGSQSQARLCVREQQAAIYREALQSYQAWLRQKITSAELISRVRNLSTRYVTPEIRAEIEFETSRLNAVLRNTWDSSSSSFHA